MNKGHNLLPNIVLSRILRLFREFPLQALSKLETKKLRLCFSYSHQHKECLTIIEKQITSKDEVVTRLKSWALLHLLIQGKINEQLSEKVSSLIENNEDRLKRKNSEKSILDIQSYFEKQVQLQYLTFLKKLNLWNSRNQSTDDIDATNQGFSQLNKIREILQLDNLFQHFKRYYPSHQYIFDLYQGCAINIKHLWKAVIAKIKNISQNSLNTRQIEDGQYLFIKEAELVQDLLVEFLYGHKISIKLPKELQIKYIILLSPKIIEIYKETRKKITDENSLSKVQKKISRKGSSMTVDTDRSSKISEKAQMQGLSPQKLGKIEKSNDCQLNTQDQREIFDTIKEIQSLLHLDA